VTDACVTPNIATFTGENADEFVFWDSIHPTKAGPAIPAQKIANVLRQRSGWV
jgi:phospholipase/lecithinase/hemolysin